MNKILCLFSAIALFLTSCTGEDSPSSVAIPTLLKKMILTYDDGSVLESDYFYTDTKLDSIVKSSGEFERYTYTGDLISRIEYTQNGTSNYSEYIIEYNGSEEVLSTIDLFHTSSPSGIKTIYTYNNDGTISFDAYSGDLFIQNIFFKSGKYFFGANNEIIKVEEYNDNGDLLAEINITHDVLNSPYKNILGYNKLFNRYTQAKFSNVLTSEWNYTGSPTSSVSSVYQYSSSGFPTSMVESFSEGFAFSYAFFYN
ncbi:hypothetical protein [Flavobacterium sp. N2270]|uniref:hypothetical protein n=1 Tax=Flavobacterium sp. N2270 TaxID=2986831 RepID=UPI002224CDD9|nr:hypothetical protein [Flavobacterium sp. N2270]